MNPEVLLQAYKDQLDTEEVLPHVSGEVILTGDRAEIIFAPEVPKSAEQEVGRRCLENALTNVCRDNENEVRKADPMIGHFCLRHVSVSDLNAIGSLPGVSIHVTAL
jgi:hypothetical protein